MARWYGLFLVRYWRLANGTERIEIEHIQTGEWALLTSLSAALAWIAAREHDFAGRAVPPPRPTDPNSHDGPD